MQQNTYLYFSARCAHCQNFMNELVKTPFVKEVTAICIDPGVRKGPLPPWLKSVPTLAVAGEDAPRVGVWAVNNWLMDRKNGIAIGPIKTSSNSREMIKPMEYNSNIDTRPVASSSQKQSYPAAVATGGALVPSASLSLTDNDTGMGVYNPLENGNAWSNGYSFLATDIGMSSSNSFDPMTHSFEPIINANINGTASGLPMSPTPISMTGQDKSSPAFTAEQQRYLDERNRGIPEAFARR